MRSVGRDAAELGIATIYQDFALCDNLDVVAISSWGRERTRVGALDDIDMDRRATHKAARLPRRHLQVGRLGIS